MSADDELRSVLIAYLRDDIAAREAEPPPDESVFAALRARAEDLLSQLMFGRRHIR